MSENGPLLPKFDYQLDESDPDVLVLRRQDGAFVAAFSACGATEEGNDMVAARNEPAHRDWIACGPGFDRVMADGEDVVADGCERVADTQSEVDALFGSIPQSFWEGLPPVFG